MALSCTGSLTVLDDLRIGLSALVSSFLGKCPGCSWEFSDTSDVSGIPHGLDMSVISEILFGPG